MKRIVKNLFQLLRRPRMMSCYAKWLTGKVINGDGPRLRFGGDVRIGNFENFSHYWARQCPATPESVALFEAVQRVCPGGYAAIDVGANIGITCLVMADAGFTQVIALEPTPDSFERLRKNVRLNRRLEPRIIALQAAVGAESGRCSFHIQPGSSEQNGFVAFTNKADLANQIQVDVVTIDQLVERHGLVGVGLLKVDVEGFELDVLKGSRRSLEKGKIRYIYLELIEQALAKAGTCMAGIEAFLAECEMFPLVWEETSGFKRSTLSEALASSGADRSVLFGAVRFEGEKL